MSIPLDPPTLLSQLQGFLPSPNNDLCLLSVDYIIAEGYPFSAG